MTTHISMPPIRFRADQVAHYIEGDVQTVALADGDSPDPSRYLIRQRAIPHEGDSYYFEIGPRELAGDEGFLSFWLSSTLIDVKLSEALQKKAGISSVEISLPASCHNDHELRVALENIFSDSDCDLKFT